MINAGPVSDPELIKHVFRIREEVFVVEQKVDHREEFDEFEDESVHFLATVDGEPAGVARWRKTDKGLKLERFAVLKRFRSQGVGAALVEAVLDDIASHSEFTPDTRMYLHAQIDAIPLYSKFGFESYGDMFEECNIKHYSMQRHLGS